MPAPTMTEAAQLARSLMDSTHLTYMEAAVVADSLAVTDPNYVAVAVWLRCAGLWGTVDLDRAAKHQEENH